jgi:hypothetical protein
MKHPCVYCGTKPQKLGLYCSEKHHQLHRQAKIETIKKIREEWEDKQKKAG